MKLLLVKPVKHDNCKFSFKCQNNFLYISYTKPKTEILSGNIFQDTEYYG